PWSARASRTHRRLRHLEHQRHVSRRVDGELPQRPSRPRELSTLQDEDRVRPGRFREHGRDHPTALLTPVARSQWRAGGPRGGWREADRGGVEDDGEGGEAGWRENEK